MKKMTAYVSCAVALTATVAVAATGDIKSVTLGTESDPVWQELPTAPTAANWGGSAPAIDDGSFVVDDATYTRGTGVTPAAAVVVCNFTLTASYLDDTADIDVPKNPQTGFCIVKSGESAAVFKAYVGGEWLALQGATVPAEEAAYSLKVNLDYVNKKVQFKVDDDVLSDSTGATWFSNCQDSATDVSAVAFVGSGKVALIGRATNTIAAEVIEVVPEGETSAIDITLTAEQLAAIGNPASTEKLGNGMTALTSYILFGKASAAITAADKPQVVGVPKATAADKIAIKVQGLNVQTVPGATVGYKLMGSETGSADSWSQIGEANTTGAFEFDASTNNRFFKVVTVITYATK